MTTWCKIKTEKLAGQRRLNACGGYKRLSDNAEKPVRRDGGMRPVYERGIKDGVRALIARPTDAPIVRLPGGHASGLSDSIGNVGKGGRRASRATYGSGERRSMGLTADMFNCEVELIRG